MKIIGLSGAHRVGKSTTAKAVVAQTFGYYSMVETNAKGTFERLGLDPKADYPLLERVRIQNEILTDMEKQFAAASNFSVSDRTPLDMMAYMLADVSRAAVTTTEEDDAIVAYLARCRDSLKRHFSLVFIMQPGIDVVEAEGKAPGFVSYMEHINALCIGQMFTMRGPSVTKCFLLSRETTDLQGRVDIVIREINELPRPPGWVDVEQGKPS